MQDEIYVGALISNEYLEHHGIPGMKWGKKHGPPYPLSESVSDRIQKMKSVGQRKLDTHDAATMAKYKTTSRLHRHLSASNNGLIGQKLAVRFNKGYREDRKEIKSEYKAAKKSLDRKDEGYRAQKKELKAAYKESKTLAATRAADAIYGKQSHELNRKIQSESIGKAYLKSMLMGDYGALTYNSTRANDAAGRITSAYLTRLANSSGKVKKSGDSNHDNAQRDANRRAALGRQYANSFIYSQTGVSKADRQRVKEYVKAQKEQKKQQRKQQKR